MRYSYLSLAAATGLLLSGCARNEAAQQQAGGGGK